METGEEQKTLHNKISFHAMSKEPTNGKPSKRSSNYSLRVMPKRKGGERSDYKVNRNVGKASIKKWELNYGTEYLYSLLLR